MNDPIDRLILENLNGSAPQIEINIRKDTMSRIWAYERKKEKIRFFFQCVLMFFTGLASLASLVFSETLFNRLRVFLLFNHINPLTLKLIYQGFFASILIGLFILMIYAVGSREDFSSVSHT